MTDFHYLDAQDRQALERQTNPRLQKGVRRSTKTNETRPLLAKAAEPISKNQQGEFRLLANKPDGLTDGAKTLQAYTLVDLKADDVAALHKMRGEDSGGYWLAVAVGATDCCCDSLLFSERMMEILGIEDDEYEAGTTMREKMDELILEHDCNPSDTVTCTACLDGLCPRNLTVTFSGFKIFNPISVPAQLVEDFEAFVNAVHAFEIPESQCGLDIASQVYDYGDGFLYTYAVRVARNLNGVDNGDWTTSVAIIADNQLGIVQTNEYEVRGGTTLGQYPFAVWDCQALPVDATPATSIHSFNSGGAAPDIWWDNGTVTIDSPAAPPPQDPFVFPPPTRFIGPWEDLANQQAQSLTVYKKGFQVTHDQWLMVAVNETTDPAAPVLTGQIPVYPDPPPTWTVNNHTGHVYQILEILVPEGELYGINQLRVWVQGITADDHYQVIGWNSHDAIFEEIFAFDGDVLGAPGWQNIPYRADFVTPGIVGRFWLHMWNSSSASSQNYPWARAANTNTDADPGIGAWNMSNNGTTLRINDIDDGATDRSATLLDNGLIGSVVVLTQQTDTTKSTRFTLNSITDQGAWVQYGAVQGAAGIGGEPDVGAVCDIEFQIPVVASASYASLAGHLNQFPALQSYTMLDSVSPLPAPSQDGVGIDITFDNYSISPDWDIQAYSG